MSDLNDIGLRIVRTLDDALELKRWFGERRPILAFDTETEGLHWWEHRVRMVQFGDAMSGWAIPFDDWRGLIIELMASYDGPVVGHNLRFDQRMIKTYAGITIEPHRCHDTMIAAHLIDCTGLHGLKPLSARLIHPAAVYGDEMLKKAMSDNGWNWATVPIDLPEYWTYAALDTVLTARLHEIFQPQIDELGLRDLYELEMAVSGVLARMDHHGSLVDLDYAQRKLDESETYIAQLRAYCGQQWGVNPGSDQQVVARLQADGITLTSLTQSGAYSVDKDVLGVVALDHELAGRVLDFRRVTKYAHTYFRNFLELNHGGRLYAGVRQLGARTGRMSIEDPPLQQLPKRGPIVRNAFYAAEGSKLMTFDFDQIEMRIFAHFAQEAEMLRKILSGIDIHTATAQGCYGLGDAMPTKQQRSTAKNANFSKVYGAGLERFAATAGIHLDDAKAFLDTYEITFPGVRAFQRQVEGVALERMRTTGRAFVRAPSGRIHYALDNDKIYPLVNYLIQGTAADVFKRKIVEMDNAGLGDFMALLVHDEVVMEVPDEHIDDVTAIAASVMPDLRSFSVPLTVGAEGPLVRWGERYVDA